MKIPLTILALVAIILLGFVVFGPTPGPDALQRRTDLPWQITVSPDGGSQVFGLALGSATLADAMAKFGGLEGLAVFEPKTGPMSLEAYFGNVCGQAGNQNQGYYDLDDQSRFLLERS